MIATLISEGIAGMPPGTNLYSLDELFEGFEYVNVCAFEPFNQAFVIGCDAQGFVAAPTMEALWRSDSYVSHAEALAAIGYGES